MFKTIVRARKPALIVLGLIALVAHYRLSGGKLLLADPPFADQIEINWLWWFGITGLFCFLTGLALPRHLESELTSSPDEVFSPRQSRLAAFIREQQAKAADANPNGGYNPGR